MAPLPHLYVDIDGVLAFQPEGSIIAVNGRFDATYLISDPSVRNYPWAARLPPSQQRWLKANRAVIAANLAPDTLAVKVVGKAHKAGYDVTVATERDPALKPVTRAWLDYWGVPYDPLEVVGPGNKDDLLRSRSGDGILIDDAPKFEALAGDGLQVWVPPRPWTPTGDTPDGVWRFDRWGQVRKRLGL